MLYERQISCQRRWAQGYVQKVIAAFGISQDIPMELMRALLLPSILIGYPVTVAYLGRYEPDSRDNHVQLHAALGLYVLLSLLKIDGTRGSS